MADIKMKKTLLIVDDEKLVRWALKKSIERNDRRVFCASDGKEAMELMDQEQFDLIITDLVMPGSSGMDVLEKAKRIKSETKVVLMTAYGGLIDKEDAMLAGIDDFVEKPFMLNDIKKLVGNILDD